MSRAPDATVRSHDHVHGHGDDDDVLAQILGVIGARLARTVRAEELLEAPAGSRSWRKVASTSMYDAWLVAWAPGAGIPEHDHGGATAAFHVVRGTLVERTEARARVVHAGSAASVPPWRRHAVRNLGAVPALSLHVYSPPLGDSWKAD
jgi:quercetin dioxygenase-like cupin family protein